MTSDSSLNQQIHPDDPTATYRGYRRQVLYCLFRLFDGGLPSDYILHPEGEEDLAIRDPDGKLVEIIQVKDYTKNLSISDFKPIFFQRILKYCHPSSTVKVTIAYFGKLGPELLTALDNDKEIPKRTITTLRNKELKNNDISNILRHLSAEQVSEAKLQEFILGKLKGIVTSGSPQQAFENLMWWLMNASENQLRLNRQDTIEKINQIGEFLSQRLAHEEEWNTSIIPISIKQNSCSEKQKQEFYRGGRVQPIHIANNLDVRRNELLWHIDQQFSHNDIVLIRAASGQGKTTLAYRYIADYSPNDFRFEVLRPTDIQHARNMALAISGHSEAIDVPTLLYLDVRPGDKAWSEFVREIAFLPNLKILITIREEDWFKSQVSVDDFIFSEVSLHFDEKTGESLFSALGENDSTGRYLNFEDAWAQLGERKTLFEFVYFITQEQQLAQRIKEQVASLQDDVRSEKLHPNELKLLKLVAVASAYEARIQLKKLVEHCAILEPQRTLQQFSDEFLLRTSDDGHFVEGFHAIRSEIMCSQLLDDVLDPWYDYAGEVISLLDEDDLELFLLCSFSRHPKFSEGIVSALSTFTPHTWVGIRGVCIALQWLGLNNYIDSNIQVIKDARTLAGSGWWTMLDWDVAKVNGGEKTDLFSDLIDTLPHFKLAAEASQKLTELQTNKSSVFSYFDNWITSRLITFSPPSSAFELMALAEVIFWVGHLEIETPNIQWITDDLLDTSLSTLPIYLFSEFAIATRKVSESSYNDWYLQNKDRIKAKIQEESDIIAMMEEGNCLVGHYIIGLDKEASILKIKKEATKASDSSIINGLSVERVDVLHRCIPGYENYGAKGYGHIFSLLSEEFDGSEKKISVENIMSPWLPNFNSLMLGIGEMRFRPVDWNEYFSSIQSMRLGVLNELKQLHSAIQITNIRKEKLFSDLDQWNKQKSVTTDEFMLPRAAVDEWGYISEGRTGKGNQVLASRFAALTQIELFAKALTEYRHAIGDFMRQAEQAIVILLGLRMADSELKRKACLSKANELGIPLKSMPSSVMNSIKALKALEQLHKIEIELKDKVHHTISISSSHIQEYEQLHKTVYLWCKFAYPDQFPDQSKVPKKRTTVTVAALEKGLRSSLTPTFNRIKNALIVLKKQGIRAYIHNEDVDWQQENALWISFDVDSPIESLNVLEVVWGTLIETLQPDCKKTVRQSALGYYWERIILVPLVKGKSVDRQVYANMQISTAHLFEAPHDQAWRFFSELVSEETWNRLSLPVWGQSKEWSLFQDFADAYTSLYLHIEHLADITRIESVESNSVGKNIFNNHQESQQKHAEPYLQKVLNAIESIANNIPELTNKAIQLRPHINDCFELVCELRDIVIPPVNEAQGTYALAGKEISAWRDQLKSGLSTLGIARYLWITDLLEEDFTNEI